MKSAAQRQRKSNSWALNSASRTVFDDACAGGDVALGADAKLLPPELVKILYGYFRDFIIVATPQRAAAAAGRAPLDRIPSLIKLSERRAIVADGDLEGRRAFGIFVVTCGSAPAADDERAGRGIAAACGSR